MIGTKQFALCRSETLRSRSGSVLPLSAFALLAWIATASAQRLPLPPEEQEAVNNAVDRGVDYLKRTQQKKGTWAKPGDNYTVGYAMLPALTLLECGTSPKDPLVQKAAAFLRAQAAHLDTTYELALAILFLDRLGDPKDEKLLQAFALRLIAGQSMTGGWGYKCPILTKATQMDLLTALRHLDPPGDELPLLAGNRPAAPGMVGGIAKKADGDLTPTARGPAAPSLGTSTAQTTDSSLSGSTNRPISRPGESSSDAKSTKELEQEAKPAIEKPSPPKTESTKEKAQSKSAAAKPKKPYVIPEHLSILTVIQNPDRHVLQDPKDKAHDLIVTSTDNSNTQFAILALWTAQRHGIPMKRTLNLVVRRFLTSQNADGSWNYHYLYGGGDNGESPAMTCVGLIGLAVGHGLAQPKLAGQRIQDPRLIKGLIALNKNVGTPVNELVKQPLQSLYFLWSVERVAVLYNLPKIGDKDWYRWGAQLLITNQDDAGYWKEGHYHGSSPVLNTCLALLFLKRANLAKDLTAKLPFQAVDLNDSILQTGKPVEKKPLPAKKTVVVEKVSKPEPETLLVKPVSEPAAPSQVEPEDTSSGKKKWILVSLVVFLVFAGGSLFLLLNARQGAETEEDENRAQSKAMRKNRRKQSTATAAKNRS